MYTNTLYDVFLAIDVSSGASGLATARLDPTFTVTPTGQTVLFSPGIAPPAPVPEPAVWSMMILGFAGAGLSLRRRPRLT
jgi:hypothetical protein